MLGNKCLHNMNIDRRLVSGGHGTSDDSGSDDEENLRVSKTLKTHEHVIDKAAGLTILLPNVCKFIPGRIKHSKGRGRGNVFSDTSKFEQLE